MKAQDLLTEQDKLVFEKAGFGKKQILGKKPMFLVVDVTYEFLGPVREPILESIKRSPTSCGEYGYAAADSIARILPSVRAANVPVAYSIMDRTVELPCDRKESRSGEKRNPEWNKVVKEIEPQPGDTVIAKFTPSVYLGTKLLLVQMYMGIDTVVIVGGTTSGCLRATAVDAFGYGFKVVVVEEATFDRGEVSAAVSLFDMNAKYVDVLSEQQAIDYFVSLKA